MRKHGRTIAGLLASLALALATLPASAMDKVKVGVFPVSSSLPYFVAIDLGYFKEFNIEPETIKLMGGPPNVAALMTNQIEVSAVLVTLEGLNANVRKPGVAMYVAMHMRGNPRTMRDEARYDDVVREVADELRVRVEAAFAAGIDPAALLADPGIGFAKTPEHNVALLRALPEVAATAGVPLVVGTSRKSFLARVVGDDVRHDVAYFLEIRRTFGEEMHRGLGVREDGGQRLAQLMGQGAGQFAHGGNTCEPGDLVATALSLEFRELALARVARSDDGAPIG